MDSHILLKHPELKELLYQFRYEVQQAQRPASEVVLDDEDVMNKLKISKRKLQYLISEGIIPYHRLPGSPRRYYLLKDILDLLEENRIESIKPSF